MRAIGVIRTRAAVLLQAPLERMSMELLTGVPNKHAAFKTGNVANQEPSHHATLDLKTVFPSGSKTLRAL